MCRTNNKTTRIRPLVPEYDEKRHGVYLHALTDALEDPRVKNIALSGPYGSGKSSILAGLDADEKYNRHIVWISVSSLRPQSELMDQSSRAETVDRIEREIFKQLIYSVPPQKLPRSRFARMDKTNRALVWATAILITLFLAHSISSHIRGLAQRLIDNFPYASLAGALLLMAMFAWIASETMHWFGFRFSAKSVVAGPAVIDVEDSGGKAFDIHLDEIVYFFTKADKSIVIFEDIDRFETFDIFEELLLLNSLLNRALKNKVIKFVYAIKDDVFNLDKNSRRAELMIGDLAAEPAICLEAASKAKIFDQIIPIMPFVGHFNAEAVFKQELGDDFPFVERSVSTLAKFVPDARAIRAICNEFKLVDTVTRRLNLSAGSINLNERLALLIYKAVHIEEFQRVLIGTSQLDIVCDAFDRLRRNELSNVAKGYALIEKDIDSTELSKQTIREYCSRLLIHLSTEFDNADRLDVTVLNVPFTAERTDHRPRLLIELDRHRYVDRDLWTRRFWEHFASAPDGRLRITNRATHEVRILPVSEVASAAHLVEPSKQPLRARQSSLRRQRDMLGREIDVINELTLDTLFVGDRTSTSITQIRKLLDEEIRTLNINLLLREMIHNGFVSSSFNALFATNIEDNFSVEALSYFARSVKGDTPNVSGKLSDSDIECLLDRTSSADWRGKSGCNYYILSSILTVFKDDAKAEVIVSHARDALLASANLTDELASYAASLRDGRSACLLSWMSSFSLVPLDYILMQAGLKSLSSFFETATINGSMSNEDVYYVEQVIRTFRRFFDSAEDSLAVVPGSVLAQFFEALQVRGLRIADLRSVPSPISETIIAAGLFDPSISNFAILRDEYNLDSFMALLDLSPLLADFAVDNIEIVGKAFSYRIFNANDLNDPRLYDYLSRKGNEGNLILEALLRTNHRFLFRAHTPLPTENTDLLTTLANHQLIETSAQTVYEFVHLYKQNPPLGALFRFDARISRVGDLSVRHRLKLYDVFALSPELAGRKKKFLARQIDPTVTIQVR